MLECVTWPSRPLALVALCITSACSTPPSNGVPAAARSATGAASVTSAAGSATGAAGGLDSISVGSKIVMHGKEGWEELEVAGFVSGKLDVNWSSLADPSEVAIPGKPGAKLAVGDYVLCKSPAHRWWSSCQVKELKGADTVLALNAYNATYEQEIATVDRSRIAWPGSKIRERSKESSDFAARICAFYAEAGVDGSPPRPASWKPGKGDAILWQTRPFDWSPATVEELRGDTIVLRRSPGEEPSMKPKELPAASAYPAVASPTEVNGFAVELEGGQPVRVVEKRKGSVTVSDARGGRRDVPDTKILGLQKR